MHLGKDKYRYDTNPDTCPLCHHGIDPAIISTNAVERSAFHENTLQIIFSCPRKDCQRAFIASYTVGRNLDGVRNRYFSLRNTAPYRGEEADITNEIKSLSSNFTEIFNQAHTAEHYGLDQIAGVGYRKALEFLIKDYCISKHTDKEEEIKGKFLGACINEFVDDANIKTCASRAAWLGNDETHYVRKWEGKDIKDLKILITLTMAWITNNILTELYLADMN